MSKITESARGQDCQIRIPYVCTHDPEQTVWCHANGSAPGKGIGMKSYDATGAYGCYACHMVYDGYWPIPKAFTRQDIDLYFHEGHQRSLRILIEKGLVKA